MTIRLTGITLHSRHLEGIAEVDLCSCTCPYNIHNCCRVFLSLLLLRFIQLCGVALSLPLSLSVCLSVSARCLYLTRLLLQRGHSSRPYNYDYRIICAASVCFMFFMPHSFPTSHLKMTNTSYVGHRYAFELLYEAWAQDVTSILPSRFINLRVRYANL